MFYAFQHSIILLELSVRPSLTWVLKTLQPIYRKNVVDIQNDLHGKEKKNRWVANFAFFSLSVFLFIGQESFNSKSLALQAQKKILSKMATMAVANLLTDDTSSEILDELYKASREFTKSKKEAHKIIKDVIKIALKIGILYRNHQFSQDEMETVERFKKKMNQAAMTVVSFYEVEYTFDRGILSELLMECRDLLHELVEHHLTMRSHGRIDHVFNHFADVDFLTELYGPSEEYRFNLRKICDGINKLLDEGTL